LNHASLSVTIAIEHENINEVKYSIAKNSEEEANFIKGVLIAIKKINISDLSNISKLEKVVNSLISSINYTWNKNSKHVKITKHFKSWWNKECNHTLINYRTTRSLEDWKMFKSQVKSSKHNFFDIKIQEIANKRRGPWELMSWVNKHKLPTIEAIKYNGQHCFELGDLWNALHSTFNTVLHHQVDINILDKIGDKPTSPWLAFSKEEFRLAIINCNNSSTLGPDKLSWSHLKIILKDDDCLDIIISITNTCIELGYWPSHFKRSTMIIIPKPNKKLYDLPKAFRPIVLLNIVGKLIEKVIGERLQFNMASNKFIHPSQLGGLKFKSTVDADVALTHIICTGWVKNLSTSTLAFDIAQFFLLLNHCLLSLIMRKVGFNNHIVFFFANYLIDRKTNYFWNNFMSPVFNVNVGVGQGSVLSPILSVLYLLSFIYILENCLKNLKISISIISFVDDSFFISQSNSFDISNSHLFCSYNVLTNLLEKFGLIVEHSKTEIFYFDRSHGAFNPPPLDLTPLEGNILQPNNT